MNLFFAQYVRASESFKILARRKFNGATERSCIYTLILPDFRERAAIFDHTVLGALSPPHTSRAPGFATKDQAQARNSNAAQGNTQDTEAT